MKTFVKHAIQMGCGSFLKGRVWQVFILSFCLLYTGVAIAHDPVFGFGAHVVYKEGYETELEYEGEKAGAERESVLVYGIGYGVTPGFTVSLSVPHILRKKNGNASSSGVGDMSVGGKYRFLRIDEPGSQSGLAAFFRVKLPSGDETRTPATGTGSTDYLIGLAASRESIRNYWFADIHSRINSEANGERKGNILYYNVAFGRRPGHSEYLKPDLVLIAELNGEHEEKAVSSVAKDPDTGGDRLFISPTFLLSYRNVMFKGGVQLPIYQDLNGTQDNVDYRAKFSIELHL